MRISTTNADENENYILVNADDIRRFRDLFITELKDIYWTEKAFSRLIPRIAGDASEPELKEMLTTHIDLMKEHEMRVEDVFATVGKIAEEKVCEAMWGLIVEMERIVDESKSGLVKDAAIIVAVQRMLHYKIVTYGALCSFANTLDESEGAALLYKNLSEVKEADEVLTGIAEAIQREISVQAVLMQYYLEK